MFPKEMTTEFKETISHARERWHNSEQNVVTYNREQDSWRQFAQLITSIRLDQV